MKIGASVQKLSADIHKENTKELYNELRSKSVKHAKNILKLFRHMNKNIFYLPIGNLLHRLRFTTFIDKISYL